MSDPCPLCTADPDPVVLLLLEPSPEEPEPGAWCDRCLLPSAVSFGIIARCGHGWPSGVQVGPVRVCLDCDLVMAPRPPFD